MTKEVTDLVAWEILQITATHNLSFKEACKVCGVRLCDFVDFLMASGVLAEAMRRLPQPTRERLVKITWTAVSAAFADDPSGMLAVMQGLEDITPHRETEGRWAKRESALN